MVAPSIVKKTTNYRQPIDPEERLAVCLRFLSTGDSFTTIAASFRMGISTVSGIVKETCNAIWQCLKDTYMPRPSEEHWLSVAKAFGERWNFPNCIGALDGKHINLQAPDNSGSLYFNHKGSFSIVLLALVDPDYRFLVVDVGSYGSNSDGGVFAQSNLGKGLRDGSLSIPPPTELPGAPELGKVNHVIVADAAFPMKPYLLRPYPGRHLPEDKKIYNYRHSRGRRISENAFGIMSQQWRVFRRHLQVSPSIADTVVKAGVILHNFVRPPVAAGQCRPSEDDDTEESPLQSIRGQQGNHASAEALQIRDMFKTYFNSPAGELEWQYRHVNRGLF